MEAEGQMGEGEFPKDIGNTGKHIYVCSQYEICNQGTGLRIKVMRKIQFRFVNINLSGVDASSYELPKSRC